MFFSKILDRTKDIKTVLEFGSNVGLNLIAIKSFLPKIELSAVEINEKAAEELIKKNIKVYNQSILDFSIDYKRDFVFTKGVLIHLNPNVLKQVYELLYTSTNKYICIAEYYNPTPVEVPYRGFDGFLFKRDFAGELLERYKDLYLVDYGFAYKRDNNYSLIYDDITWFLLEKK